MFQIRIHGRGGQGVVTAAEMLSIAAFLEGKYAQAFPSFGSERMGAPVTAFCRIDDKEIRIREPIQEPDALIVQDKTVIKPSNALNGLKKDGYVLINTTEEIAKDGRTVGIDATKIALEYVGKPIPNAILLGGFAALTGIIKFESVVAAINNKFSGVIAEKNIQAAQVAYEKILGEMKC